MLLTPTKVARGALLRFCRICERREGPGSGLGIVRRLERARVDGSDGSASWVCLMLCAFRSVCRDSLTPRIA